MSGRILAFVSCVWLSVAMGQTTSPTVVVKAAHLVDVLDGKIIDNAVVVIEGERVKAVGTGIAIPAGAKTIDLGDSWLLPGLIDCHTHITSQIGNYYDDLFRTSPIDEAVYAHVYARRTLDAGFTTCRNVGANEFIDVALRNAIDAGKIPGPHLFVSGQ